MKKILQRILQSLGFRVVRYRQWQKIETNLVWRDKYYKLTKLVRSLKLLLPGNDANRNELLQKLPAKAEWAQDVFVLQTLNFKKNGYFVEFGACDGIFGSNTYLLEEHYGWQGILAEPARIWHKNLYKQRNCHIDTRVITAKSGQKIQFHETQFPTLSNVTPAEVDCSSYDKQKGAEMVEGLKVVAQYEVESLSLLDLLKKYNAPKIIDYISIDVEGYELEILKHFDFQQYQFRTITVEHLQQPVREEIYELLIQHGYVRKRTDMSEIDDWYVKESLL